MSITYRYYFPHIIGVSDLLSLCIFVLNIFLVFKLQSVRKYDSAENLSYAVFNLILLRLVLLMSASGTHLETIDRRVGASGIRLGHSARQEGTYVGEKTRHSFASMSRRYDRRAY